jgi:hypothetical protein
VRHNWDAAEEHQGEMGAASLVLVAMASLVLVAMVETAQ